MFYLLTFVIAAISPAFPLISIEGWAVFIGLIGQRPWFLTALVAATGQLLCFACLYFVGQRWVVKLPWIQRRLRFFEPGRYQRHAHWFYLTAAVIGLPPLNLISIAAPLMDVAFPLFAAIAFLGRLLRLSLLVGFAQKLQSIFPVDALPEWLRAWA